MPKAKKKLQKSDSGKNSIISDKIKVSLSNFDRSVSMIVTMLFEN